MVVGIVGGANRFSKCLNSLIPGIVHLEALFSICSRFYYWSIIYLPFFLSFSKFFAFHFSVGDSGNYVDSCGSLRDFDQKPCNDEHAIKTDREKQPTIQMVDFFAYLLMRIFLFCICS